MKPIENHSLPRRIQREATQQQQQQQQQQRSNRSLSSMLPAAQHRNP